MNKHKLMMIANWVLVLGGLCWAYEGFTGTDLIEKVFGNLEPAVDILVFGVASVYAGYHMLTNRNR